MLQNHLPLLPLFIPFSGGILLFLLKKFRPVQAPAAFTILCVSFLSSVLLLHTIVSTGFPAVFQVGGWKAPFGITLVGDMTSGLFLVMSQGVLLLGVLYAWGCKDKCTAFPAFYPLFLFLASGLSGGFLTGDIFNLFVFIELLAISSTVLTSISDDRLGAEAAFKYFYMSQLAAFFLLLSIGALYIGCGTLNMAQIADHVFSGNQALLLPFAVAFLMAALLIKTAAFPFHFWQPDFHTAAPTPVSAMLSSIVVKLGVYGLIRMTTLLFPGHAPSIQILLIILGICGIALGGISAIGTYNVKRMLAYSTLAQVGFILVAIGWGTPLSLAAAIIFSVNHSLAKSAMLMLAGFVSSRAHVKSAAFDVVTGAGRSLPGAGLLFFIGSLSLAGIPPTNGFISKMIFFKSGIEAEALWAVLLIGIAGSLTLVYTLKAFMKIWWLSPAEGTAIKPSGDTLAAPLILVIFILLFGIFAGPLVDLSLEAARWLSLPDIYIHSVLGD